MKPARCLPALLGILSLALPAPLRASPLDSLLTARHEALRKTLARERKFRERDRLPAHEEAFALYWQTVEKTVQREGNEAARAEWQALATAAPGQRPGMPAFAALLRDYAALRYGPDVVDATQRLIRCRTFLDSAAPSGDNPQFALARAVMDSLARAHDFEFSARAGGLAVEMACGSGPDTLGLWGHLDVVPADTAGWSSDPWVGLVTDGVLRGRGAEDDKGPVAAAFFALRALRDTGVPLRSRIALVAGFAEETSWNCINGYLQERPAPSRNIVIDGAFPVGIAEKGTVTLVISSSLRRMTRGNRKEGFLIQELAGGTGPGTVPAEARIRLAPRGRATPLTVQRLQRKLNEFNLQNKGARLRSFPDGSDTVIEAAGRSAHAACPEKGHNAITDLAAFMHDLDATGDQPAHWILWLIHEFVGGEISGRGLGIAASDSLMGGTTVNVGKVGVSTDSAYVSLNIRFPRGLTADEIHRRVADRIGPFNERYQAGLAVWRLWRGLEPIWRDPGEPLVAALRQAYRQAYGRDEGPVSLAGTSYAKRLPGAVTFGPEQPGQEPRGHAPDEYLTLQELDRLTRAYATALLMLSAESR